MIGQTSIQYTFSTIPQVASAIYALTTAFMLQKIIFLYGEENETV